MITEKPETSGLDCPFIPGLIGVIGTGRVSAPLIQYCDTAYVIWCFVDDVFYVVLLIFPMGEQAFKSSDASEHVEFLPR